MKTKNKTAANGKPSKGDGASPLTAIDGQKRGTIAKHGGDRKSKSHDVILVDTTAELAKVRAYVAENGELPEGCPLDRPGLMPWIMGMNPKFEPTSTDESVRDMLAKQLWKAHAIAPANWTLPSTIEDFAGRFNVSKKLFLSWLRENRFRWKRLSAKNIQVDILALPAIDPEQREILRLR